MAIDSYYDNAVLTHRVFTLSVIFILGSKFIPFMEPLTPCFMIRVIVGFHPRQDAWSGVKIGNVHNSRKTGEQNTS